MQAVIYNWGMRTTRSRLAPSVLVLLATGFDALFPLAVVIGLPDGSPLIFATGIVAGLVFMSITYLALASPAVLKTVWRTPAVLGRHLSKPLFWLMLGGRLNRPLFVIAVALAGATLPTLVIGLVPIAYMLMLQRSLGSDRYQAIGRWALPPLALAFAGVSLVVVSQPFGGIAGSWWLVVAGLAVSLGAVIAAALTTLDLPWGIGYIREAAPTASTKDEVGASILGTILAATLVMPCLFVAGLLLQPGGTIVGTFVSGILIGIIIRAPFTILVRIANFDTTNVTINAIVFLAPLVSLGLLIVFGYTTEVQPWIAAGGGLAIVAANLLLASQRTRYR